MLFDHPKVRGRRGARPVVHVVRRGDTLYGIAQRLGTDVSTLARLNNMQAGDPIHAGQRLVVSSKVAHGRTAKGNIETLPNGGGRQVTYTVRTGDTLWSISQLLQVTVRQLLGWNDLASPHALRPGQKLVAFVSHGG
jgi:membrane-bound lytic murein transglycosylase D